MKKLCKRKYEACSLDTPTSGWAEQIVSVMKFSDGGPPLVFTKGVILDGSSYDGKGRWVVVLLASRGSENTVVTNRFRLLAEARRWAKKTLKDQESARWSPKREGV